MQAAKLDTLVTIERPVAGVDPDYGTPIVTWVPLVAQSGSPTIAERFWAEVQDVMPSRAEIVTQGLVVARNQTRIRLRYRSDIDSSMRVIVHRDVDVTYSIVGGPAMIEGRKVLTEIVCERISS